ncbi:hypothetical protein GCM10009092_33800 [Bowmanella denitrificans]|uniref:Methyltransferase domain-containing protein n=1 Tax=Bowmanella denitrificans TaxID=366582 RepID=A0ABP3HD78_9ALTE
MDTTTSNSRHVNLSAYEGVEALENFTPERFADYCRDKLLSSDKFVEFIRQHCAHDPDWQGKVAEIGSGNSKLLYNLEKQGLLKEGLGIEISRSRHEFANKFAEHIGSQRVTNLNEDVFNLPTLTGYDLVIGVDIVLQLISPLFDKAEDRLLDWVHSSLRPGGRVLFELWDFEYFKALLAQSDNALRLWEEFPASDPFEYCLATLSFDDNKDIVWDKRFIRRSCGQRSEFSNILRPYSPEGITKILAQAGFVNPLVIDCSKEGPDGAQGEFLVLAQKAL